MKFLTFITIFLCLPISFSLAHAEELERLPYNHPGLVVDVGVGLWAQPMVFDLDDNGTPDLLLATADVPYKGTYFFSNPGSNAAAKALNPGGRIGGAVHNMSLRPFGRLWEIVTPGQRHSGFLARGLSDSQTIPLEFDPPFERVRANQWRFVDFNGDNEEDIVIGLGVWDDYGWDDAFDADGNWTNGAIHGYVYVAINTGTTEKAKYAEPYRLNAGGEVIDVYGAPSPTFSDFDSDGDLDLVCGEFLDRLSYFENIGTRAKPSYAKGRFLRDGGDIIHMDLEMLQVTSFDWNGDGAQDLIVGQEDGRVALLEHTGIVEDGLPRFDAPRFFQQQAADLKVGALATPYGVDWDGDGDEDLIVGDTAGYLTFVENLDGANPPKWGRPAYLEAGGEVIRIQAGPNGSIQGPCEAKWGYTVPSVGDWNGDGRPDIMINSIWGEILWYENDGTRTVPSLAAARPVKVAWEGAVPKPAWSWWDPKENQLVTQWRTSPMMYDLNEDGLLDLVMLDHEGYLAFFERELKGGELVLLPGKRVFRDGDGDLLRLNKGTAGKSGRRKLALTDWDGDGKIDLLANGVNIDFWKNVSTEPGSWVFENQGPVSDHKLAGHTTCPALVDWDKDGRPDLVIGAEDGFFYYKPNPY